MTPAHEFSDGNDHPGGAECACLPEHIGGYQHLEPDVIVREGDIFVQNGRPVAFVGEMEIGWVVKFSEGLGYHIYRKYPVAKQGDNDDTGWKGVAMTAKGCERVAAVPADHEMRCAEDPAFAAVERLIARDMAIGAGLDPKGEGQSAAPLPADAKARKRIPIATGFCDYFPRAIAAVAAVSLAGNEQHNPGQSLHWDRSKSGDEADALMRHFLERGTVDSDGHRHSAKMCWRACALLEKEIESEKK